MFEILKNREYSFGIGTLLLLGGAMSLLGSGVNFLAQKDQQAFNREEAEKQRQWSSSEAEAARGFNAQEAANARAFTRRMDDTKYQRQVEDMKAAGLNVGAVGASPGGASSASTASSAPIPAGSNATSAAISSSNSAIAATAMKALLQDEDTFDKFQQKYFAQSTAAAKEDLRAMRAVVNNDLEKQEHLAEVLKQSKELAPFIFGK